MSANNGTGVGKGSSAEARLLKKLNERQGEADAIRLVLGILREDAVEKKTKRHASVIEEALEIEASRNGHGNDGGMKKRGRPPGNGTKKHKKYPTPKAHTQPGYNTVEALQARRAYSRKLLAAFDSVTPRSFAEAGLETTDGQILGSLARYGYLKRKGKKDGRLTRFVRTGLAFSEAPTWRTTGS